MSQKYPTPSPIFDTLENIAKQKRPPALRYAGRDFEKAIEFLKQYNGSQATFTAYRGLCGRTDKIGRFCSATANQSLFLTIPRVFWQ